MTFLGLKIARLSRSKNLENKVVLAACLLFCHCASSTKLWECFFFNEVSSLTKSMFYKVEYAVGYQIKGI